MGSDVGAGVGAGVDVGANVGGGVGVGVQYVGAPVVGMEDTVGAGDTVGADVGDTVGSGVGAGVGQLSICTTPHDVDAHGVPENACCMVWPSPQGSKTSSSTHQPRSWSKAEAPSNKNCISLTLSTAQPLMSWLKAEA